MKNIKKRIVRMTTPIIFGLAPVIAIAAAPGNTTGSNTPPAPIQTVSGLINLLCAAFGWLFYGLMALSLIMIVIAGFTYVTANGNAEKVGKASKIILYAVVGIAVALLAKGLPAIVANFIGASGTFTQC
jgi:hypothetical protein